MNDPLAGPTRLNSFKTRCLVWAYCLADPRNGETDTVEGGRRDTEAAVELAGMLRGMRVVGAVGLVPRADSGGTIELELLDPADRWMVHVGHIAALKWEAGLVERGTVTPVGLNCV